MSSVSPSFDFSWLQSLKALCHDLLYQTLYLTVFVLAHHALVQPAIHILRSSDSMLQTISSTFWDFLEQEGSIKFWSPLPFFRFDINGPRIQMVKETVDHTQLKPFVTGFANRDHIPHFEMCVLQRRIFLQCYVQSKSNIGIL